MQLLDHHHIDHHCKAALIGMSQAAHYVATHLLAVWISGNALASISVDALCQTLLVPV